MAPSHCIDLTPAEQQQLLVIARASIAAGLRTGRPLQLDVAPTGVLGEPRGNFVTLMKHGQLRGCIGSLMGYGSLAINITHSAFKAAFHDPRFAPLKAAEFESLSIDISVLSVPEPLQAQSRDELLAQIEARRHGLIVEDAGRRGTLLPKVWEKIPDAAQFIERLLLKAGLPPDYWSDTIVFQRYEAFEFAEETAVTAPE
jgi:AmmeMemoRadiSam system protein A